MFSKICGGFFFVCSEIVFSEIRDVPFSLQYFVAEVCFVNGSCSCGEVFHEVTEVFPDMFKVTEVCVFDVVGMKDFADEFFLRKDFRYGGDVGDCPDFVQEVFFCFGVRFVYEPGEF